MNNIKFPNGVLDAANSSHLSALFLYDLYEYYLPTHA
jgi:hypothetical protein